MNPGFSVGTSGKEPTSQCRRHKQTGVQSLSWEDSLGEGIAPLSSVLAYRIPWTEEPGVLQSVGTQRVRHNWSNLACTQMYNTMGIFLIFRDLQPPPWSILEHFSHSLKETLSSSTFPKFSFATVVCWVTQLCPTLCDPKGRTVAHQAPLSMGFSRQEY